MGLLRPRLITAIIASIGFAAASYFIWQSYTIVHFLPKFSIRALSSVPAQDSRPKVSSGDILVSLEEIQVNIESRLSPAPRSLAMKVELDLFDDSGKSYLEQRQPALRDVMIQTSLEQDYESLSTASGKLLFKELLVTRMNEFLRRPVIREIHFALFYLQ